MQSVLETVSPRLPGMESRALPTRSRLSGSTCTLQFLAGVATQVVAQIQASLFGRETMLVPVRTATGLESVVLKPRRSPCPPAPTLFPSSMPATLLQFVLWQVWQQTLSESERLVLQWLESSGTKCPLLHPPTAMPRAM